MSDLEIAQRATMRPIGEIAAAAGINADALELYGRYKAKIDPAKLTARRRRTARRARWYSSRPCPPLRQAKGNPPQRWGWRIRWPGPGGR